MDDAHIFAAEDQIVEEVGNILDMMMKFYDLFGFEYDFRLATRPELFAGTEKNWDKAEKDLEEALKKKKLKYTLKPQDGAFYGPKIDVHIKDTLGREWQLATVQLDFHQPEAFELNYVDDKGQQVRPVMIHRAILGSFERFIAILIEQYQGACPVWHSPEQMILLPIADRHLEFAEKVNNELKNAGIRSEVDTRSERLQAKIRDGSLQKVPFMGIIGDREIETGSISVRVRGGEDEGSFSIDSLKDKIKEKIDKKI